MWTPKRVVLLVVGFTLFFTGYFTYSFVLGGIDGLPPLPQDLLIAKDPDSDSVVKSRVITVDEKLGKAFGYECPELKRVIKLELARNNMVLAADDHRFDDQGRLVLKPFSVAMFGKPKNDGKGPEINTIRADVAYLTFDKPIYDANPNNMNGRKIVGAELTGNIEIINNRRTARRDDDLELFIKTGPLYYEEDKHLIWTYDDIHVTDRHIDAPPNQVWGKGMELELQVETPPPTQPAVAGKTHQGTITGVKRITLQSHVVMDLFVDGNSGFMNHSQEKATTPPQAGAKEPTAKVAAEPANLHITTPGRFNYLLFKNYDLAHFEVAPGAQPNGGVARPVDGPADVTVVRHNKMGTDQLYCQVLDLKLTRKESAKPAGADKDAKPGSGDQRDADQNFTIEWVHATADRSSKVTITSDSEKLAVTDVIDLMHEAKTGVTVLKGNPQLRADKEDNLLFASQMTIEEMKIPASERTYQKATASGPGRIDLIDKKGTQANKRTQHAYWNDKLISTKDERTLTAKGEMQDMLILTGNARFEDEEHDQKLKGDTLKVWLLSTGEKKVEKATPAPSSQTAGQAGGAKADHLEAIGNVSLRSKELNIHDTARLVVWFKDAPPSMLPTVLDDNGKARTTLPPIDPLAPDRPPTLPRDVPSPLPPGPRNGPVAPPPSQPIKVEPLPPALPGLAAPQPGKPGEPARPIDLTARSVEAWVLREETKNTLEKLWCEGYVIVHQDPAKEGDQPVHITGDTLNMIYHPEGDLLVVTGNEDNFARLQMDKILILGPEVNIDQVANKVWVVGPGGMRVNSATTLDGKPLEKSEPLTIHWQKSMLLQGRLAEFNVNIQASQEPLEQNRTEPHELKRMACNTLQVTFDRPVSLKPGNKGEPSPKVQKLVCDQNARVSDTVYDGEKLVKYERLDAQWITDDAQLPDATDEVPGKAGQTPTGHEVRASGPGVFRVGEHGGTDPLAPPTDPKPKQGTTVAKPPAPKPAPKPVDDQLKLTVVEFGHSMYANSKDNFASFRKNVRVLNMPVEDPFMDVNIDVVLADLPEGAMYLSCHDLKVYTREEKGKKYQEMHASDQAVVQSKQFWGRAATIHFDESKDQVIFDGGPGEKATLYKFTQVGAKPQEIRGNKIIYTRSTGEFHGDKIESLQAN